MNELSNGTWSTVDAFVRLSFQEWDIMQYSLKNAELMGHVSGRELEWFVFSLALQRKRIDMLQALTL
jgi:hypothetical protein